MFVIGLQAVFSHSSMLYYSWPHEMASIKWWQPIGNKYSFMHKLAKNVHFTWQPSKIFNVLENN